MRQPGIVIHMARAVPFVDVVARHPDDDVSLPPSSSSRLRCSDFDDFVPVARCLPGSSALGQVEIPYSFRGDLYAALF